MDFDAVVIGAGVVGLAVGRAISKVTKNICIVEKNNSYGMETSSRNSEVIHSEFIIHRGH
jgi:L-2-hydroxyglutarate oxidase LhgO